MTLPANVKEERRKGRDRRKHPLKELPAAFKSPLVWAGSITGVVLALCAFAVIEIIGNERADRVAANAEVIELTCERNNAQDELLGELVSVSQGGDTFGSNIDPADLTEQDIAILTSIAKVQKLAKEAPQTEQQKIFEDAEDRLTHPPDCAAIKSRYLSGEPLDSIPSE